MTGRRSKLEERAERWLRENPRLELDPDHPEFDAVRDLAVALLGQQARHAGAVQRIADRLRAAADACPDDATRVALVYVLRQLEALAVAEVDQTPTLVPMVQALRRAWTHERPLRTTNAARAIPPAERHAVLEAAADPEIARLKKTPRYEAIARRLGLKPRRVRYILER